MRGTVCWLAAIVLIAGPGASWARAASEPSGESPAFAVVVDPARAGSAAATAAPPGESGPASGAETAGKSAAPPLAGQEGAGSGKGSAAKPPVSRPGTDGAAAADGDRFERVKAAFADFCEDWIEKLRERERHNLSKAQWETASDGAVVAEYVGYDTNHVGPQTVEHADTVPIGKLVYLELKLRRAGMSKEEALARDPEIVERTEVTEIFRYDRTGWVY